MNQYTFKVIRLTCNLKKPEMPNYVFGVHLNAYATNETGEEANLYFYGVVGSEDQSPESFVPFESLTEEIVVQWLENQGVLAPLREQLDQDLLKKIDPVIKDVDPPWIPPPPPPEPVVPPPEPPVIVNPLFNEEYIRALVYQIIEEIQSSNV